MDIVPNLRSKEWHFRDEDNNFVDAITSRDNLSPEQLCILTELKLRESYEKVKRTYNLRRRHPEYFAGQMVWRRNYVLSDASKYYSAKLAPKYVGPYKIGKKLSPWTFELVDSGGRFLGNWHAKDLKPHYDPLDSDH
ncbi:hypothetical protein RN001_001041 [Aquatica leii]|uniref:Uncharacterized protein n=1 Tax=Aquatica leii TaxID=1421715 RepID=A0AAN7PAY8_9COLE|nr:hypothetical protein RN001_001041 [Aquatica leii]